VADATVSAVSLPEMNKGPDHSVKVETSAPFEAATGVDIIVDDTLKWSHFQPMIR